MQDFIEAYRPTTFAEVLGNHHTKNIMKAWIANGFRPRSILLIGPYGLGKTSLARLMSERFACLSSDTTSIESCDKCYACTYPSNYVTEFDMPNTSIEQVRYHLRRYSRTVFTDTPILYFDELQRWLIKSQEMFLIPIDRLTNVQFIFSTTDLNAVDKGILSRSTILYVNPPSVDELLQKMKLIAQEHKIDITEAAVIKTIKLARQTPRVCYKAMNFLLCIEGQITEEVLDREEIRKAIAWETAI